jgi:succinate dehydrogenase / fumarate reductase membrane anchor subunit|tara:strand:+ start:4737 stop:5087 length:351 start_codon:yes stop_codon:yes gene_type:complete
MQTNPKEKGTGAFILQRVTGAINIVLVGFLIWLVVSLSGADRAQMAATFSNPLFAILAIVLFAVAFIHMRNGMNEVIEDYIHEPRNHSLAKAANTIFTVVIGIVALVSVLVLAFGG